MTTHQSIYFVLQVRTKNFQNKHFLSVVNTMLLKNIRQNVYDICYRTSTYARTALYGGMYTYIPIILLIFTLTEGTDPAHDLRVGSMLVYVSKMIAMWLPWTYSLVSCVNIENLIHFYCVTAVYTITYVSLKVFQDDKKGWMSDFAMGYMWLWDIIVILHHVCCACDFIVYLFIPGFLEYFHAMQTIRQKVETKFTEYIF